VRQARREIDEVIAELKAKATPSREAARRGRRPARPARPRERRARASTRRQRSSSRERSDAGVEAPAAASARSSGVGDRVIVGGLGLEAVVTSVHDGTADSTCAASACAPASATCASSSRGGQPPARVSVNVELQPRETTASDLNVIGCTVDEAITRAERFLDESLLTDQRVIRLIHGYGTGQLKRALDRFLQQHPLVREFATAPPEQGAAA
jgi:DNA mismatch repair protein MutS2